MQTEITKLLDCMYHFEFMVRLPGKIPGYAIA